MHYPRSFLLLPSLPPPIYQKPIFLPMFKLWVLGASKVLRAGECLISPKSVALSQIPEIFPLSPKGKPPSPCFPSPILNPPRMGKNIFPPRSHPLTRKRNVPLSPDRVTTPTPTSSFYTSTYPYREINSPPINPCLLHSHHHLLHF